MCRWRSDILFSPPGANRLPARLETKEGNDYREGQECYASPVYPQRGGGVNLGWHSTSLWYALSRENRIDRHFNFLWIGPISAWRRHHGTKTAERPKRLRDLVKLRQELRR